MLLAVTTGTTIGILTGFLRARVGIPSFVVTLALFLAWQGVLIQFLGAGNSFPIAAVQRPSTRSRTRTSRRCGVGSFDRVRRRLRRRSRCTRRSGDAPNSFPPNRSPWFSAGSRSWPSLGVFSVYFLNKNRNPNKGGSLILGLPWVVLADPRRARGYDLAAQQDDLRPPPVCSGRQRRGCAARGYRRPTHAYRGVWHLLVAWPRSAVWCLPQTKAACRLTPVAATRCSSRSARPSSAGRRCSVAAAASAMPSSAAS